MKHTFSCRAAALAALAATAALVATGCGAPRQADPQVVDLPVTPAAAASYTYSGAQVTYDVPAGATSLTVTAAGGQGGEPHAPNANGSGAQVSGTIAVQFGQRLLISVGGNGGDAGTSDHDPKGGWGGLGYTGGNGNAASDYLRTSGAGGGATTIQLTDTNGANPQTILVAGGGGGGGGASGNPDGDGGGGNAGCDGGSGVPVPSWVGSDGSAGTNPWGGSGGAAGGAPTGAGLRGQGGSGLGGNGGGGGGGLLGGAAGGGAKGTSPGGGGGAGSSGTFGMTNTAVDCASGSGQVTVTPQNS